MKTSTALKSNSLMVSLLLSQCSLRARVCVCVTKKRECMREEESAHNRLTFSGRITNLFIYFTLPLRWAPVFPEEGAHSKAISIRLTPPPFPASVCSPYIFLFCSSLVSSLPPDKGRLKEQSWLLLQPHLSQQEGGSKHMWTKTQKWEGGIKCVIAQVWLCTSTSDSVCVSTVNVSMCYSTYAYII